MRNIVNSTHSIRHGVYESAEKVNGKQSWVNDSSAIWFKGRSWAIGSISNKRTVSNIETYDGYGKIYCPYNVPNNKWLYFDEYWRDPENVKDIKIQCLEGKYCSRAYRAPAFY